MIKQPKRRQALKTVMKLGALAIGSGVLWSINAPAKNVNILRPPGARNEFEKSCIRCGLCVNTCPFDTLFLAEAGASVSVGTPIFVPRSQPCKMCSDIPCVVVCPTQALDIKLLTNQSGKADINKAQMGVAVVDNQSCLAYRGIRCDTCYRVCPLIDKAIKIDYRHNKQTGAHANFIPVVDNDICTGCGMCEHACITEKAAITVVSRDLVIGFDSHKDPKEKEQKKQKSRAVDYLNSGDML